MTKDLARAKGQGGFRMGLFSKKLTSAQEVELQDFARTLQEVRQHWEQALINIQSGTRDLYYICRQALEENRELKTSEYLLDVASDYRHVHFVPRRQGEKVDTSTLIERAKEAIQRYTDFLRDMKVKVLFNKPADWYPKRYRKEYRLWDSYFKGILPYLDAATGALRPPEPLKHDPKHGSKLDAFAWALNSVVMFYHESIIPVDFDLRVETERLRML